MPPSAVLLFEDETILRLFPVLRRAWARKGEAAPVGITGKNAKGVLFGTINLCTGHRILLQRPALDQAGFQAFFQVLRRSYPGREVWLLLDGGTPHTAPKSQALLWMKTGGDAYRDFYWQSGYGAFSVNPYEADSVIDYILNQKARHAKRPFQDEFRAFLKKYRIGYDERYVWD